MDLASSALMCRIPRVRKAASEAHEMDLSGSLLPKGQGDARKTALGLEARNSQESATCRQPAVVTPAVAGILGLGVHPPTGRVRYSGSTGKKAPCSASFCTLHCVPLGLAAHSQPF